MLSSGLNNHQNLGLMYHPGSQLSRRLMGRIIVNSLRSWSTSSKSFVGGNSTEFQNSETPRHAAVKSASIFSISAKRAQIRSELDTCLPNSLLNTVQNSVNSLQTLQITKKKHPLHLISQLGPIRLH